MENKGYKKLRVYEEAHKLVKGVYLVTDRFPKSELFGLTSQMRRAVVSVVANILEGQARSGRREFKQFLNISNGSLVELEYYLELAVDLKYFSGEQYRELENQRHSVGLLLGGLIKHVSLDT